MPQNASLSRLVAQNNTLFQQSFCNFEFSRSELIYIPEKIGTKEKIPDDRIVRHNREIMTPNLSIIARAEIFQLEEYYNEVQSKISPIKLYFSAILSSVHIDSNVNITKYKLLVTTYAKE